MKNQEEEPISTHASLLRRLENWDDHTSWQVFFDTYWRLIYGVARKSGLSEAEAQDVVQETLISVSKHMPTFKYDPALGSFKAWLLNLTRWRIVDQFRKRKPCGDHHAHNAETGDRTSTIQAVADPNAANMEELWEREWERNIFKAALHKLRLEIDPQRYQVFDFYVVKEWPAEKVATEFGVSVEQVYQIKHRVTDVIRKEVERLKNGMT
jgi:RNA polymerase sigma-70 factor (ECF subfamily)